MNPHDCSRETALLRQSLRADCRRSGRSRTHPAYVARNAHPGVDRLLTHLPNYKGKRLRPGFCSWSPTLAARSAPAHHLLAAVTEMIHTATLVHDDVLDHASCAATCRRSTRSGAIRRASFWAIICSRMHFTCRVRWTTYARAASLANRRIGCVKASCIRSAGRAHWI